MGITPYRKDRCANHKDREVAPRLCHICQRILVELEIVERTVKALLEDGYALQTNDGDEHRPEAPTRDAAVILKELAEVDMEHLMAFKSDQDTLDAWVYFVYGNDGYDVISDYTTNLQGVLQPILDYADTLA
jgi:hypothetical protein